MQSHVDSNVNAHLQMVVAHGKLQEKQIEQQKKQIRTLNSQVHMPTSTLQSRLPPVFTMPNFKQHKIDRDRWFSPPFYSHIGGYKMYISVYANGFGEGEDSHLSVYLCMMKGEHDDNLKWPFHGEVSVQLLNQQNANHYEVEEDYSADDIMRFVDRVKGVKQPEPGWGYDEFIPHEKLTCNPGSYLMNDCLKFQVNKVVVL